MRSIILSLLVTISFVGQSFADEYAGPKVGDQASDVSLSQVDQNNMKGIKNLLSTDQEGRFLLLEFSTTWCPSCKENLPIVSKLSKEISETTTTRIVLVDRSTTEVMEKYIADNRELILFDAALDNERVAWKIYSTGYVPTSYLVGRDGAILWKKVGTFSTEDIEDIKKLVQ